MGVRNPGYLSDDAKNPVVKKGTTVCPGHRCTLDYNRTNSTSTRDGFKEGEDRENTITVTVTAENGYDDHEYSLTVMRAAPINDELMKEHFLRIDLVDGEEEETPAVGTGDGKTVSRAFTMETKNASGSSMNMRIDLMELGVPGERNEYCAQRVVMVKEYNDDDEDALDALNPADDEDRYEDDVCRDTRYRLSVNRLYEIEIESEDSVSETYYLNTRNRDKSEDGALESLEVEGTAVTLRHPQGNADTAFMNVVQNVDTVTVEWETRDENALVTASPRDTDSQEDDHQFALSQTANEEKTLTIRVVSEDRSDTAHYGLVVQRANDVATLASLSADVDLNETFASETTEYTADVAHDDAEVVFTFTATDSDASLNPTSPHTATLGAAGTDTDVEITVTAEDDAAMTYTVTVSREQTPADPTAGVVLMEKDTTIPFSEEITEGVTDTIDVTLAVQPTADSTVTVTITPSTGLTVVSGGSMNFTSTDWETAQELVLEAATDDDAEVADPVDLAFTFGGDTLTGYHTGTADTVEVQITETDTKGVNLNATAKEVNEAVAGTYTVVLNSQPVGGNVNIEISGAPSDVTLSATQLEFTSTDWSTAQTVTITPTDDADTASHGAFDLSHAVLGGGYTGMNVEDVSVQVLDDEASQVVVSTTGVTVNEGGSFTYTISLTDEPSADETVTVDLNFNTGDFTSTETTVTFTTGDTSEEITITARNVTADAVRTISYTVSVTDTSTDDQVYDDSTTASSTSVTVKNVPE